MKSKMKPVTAWCVIMKGYKIPIAVANFTSEKTLYEHRPFAIFLLKQKAIDAVSESGKEAEIIKVRITEVR